MNTQSKRDYLSLLRTRYQFLSHRKEKSSLIDEVVANLQVTRKHAIKLVNKPVYMRAVPRRRKKETYGYDLIVPLKKLWEVAGYPCSKRLKPQIKELIRKLEEFQELKLHGNQRSLLTRMSSFTIDKLLAFERLQVKQHGLSGTKRSPLLKTLIPVRTEFDDVVEPGHVELDCVLHCGDSVSGIFAETLNVLDIHTHWNEKMMFLHKTQNRVIGVLHELRRQFPFLLKSIDFDNGYEFVNWRLHTYCQTHNIAFTRSRSYHKNDQAHIEAKNFQSIRKVVGYGRIETMQVVDLVNDLYRNEHRLLTNFFYTTFKLKDKHKEGGKVTKHYEQPKTPYQRVLESESTPQQVKDSLTKQYEHLNPAQLHRSLKRKLAHFQRLLAVSF